MTTDFQRLMKYIKEMQKRYHHALHAFHVYDTMVRLSASNIVGQEQAEKNVQTINQYKDFFIIAKESTRVYFFLELAKMFDNSKQSLQVDKIVNFTQSQIKNLNAESFAEYNSDRQLVDDLIKTYKGVSSEDLKVVKNLLQEQSSVIDKLIIYRDSWLAHDDINKPEIPIISVEELEKLFDTVSKIMNLLANKLNSESWMWEHVKESAEQDTKMIVNHLQRFEPYRIKEIDDELNEELRKIEDQKKSFNI